MRLLTAIIGLSLTSAAALAQPPDKVWTPAPVPGNLPTDVPPADRAGGITGRDTSTPFSGLPSGTRTGGQASQAPSDVAPVEDAATPNVSR